MIIIPQGWGWSGGGGKVEASSATVTLNSSALPPLDSRRDKQHILEMDSITPPSHPFPSVHFLLGAGKPIDPRCRSVNPCLVCIQEEAGACELSWVNWKTISSNYWSSLVVEGGVGVGVYPHIWDGGPARWWRWSSPETPCSPTFPFPPGSGSLAEVCPHQRAGQVETKSVIQD